MSMSFLLIQSFLDATLAACIQCMAYTMFDHDATADFALGLLSIVFTNAVMSVQERCASAYLDLVLQQRMQQLCLSI